MAETGSFGGITFQASAEQLKTWSGLRRKNAANYASHEVAEKKAKLEFTGVDLQQIDLDVRLDARFASPAQESQSLRDALDAGEPKPLVLGGSPLGRYVLEQITERVRYTDAQGRILVSELQLRFREYN